MSHTPYTTDLMLSYPYEREKNALLRIHLFGPFRLCYAEQPQKQTIWRRNKAKSLLKWFILHSDKPCSAEQLALIFWPDVPPENAYKNLYVTIHYLRRLLEPSLTQGQHSTFIRLHTNNFYQFHRNETLWTDIFEVQELLEAAEEMHALGEHLKAAFYYRKIASYCEQDFLPEDIYDDCFQPHRRYYERLYLQTLLRLMKIGELHNEFHEVLEYAYLALRLDPFYEPAVKAITTVHIEQGNASGAIRILNEFQKLLKEELGIDPSKDILELRQKIPNSALQYTVKPREGIKKHSRS
jgi:DNA-binding SARP family transcriptional activator